jgi:plasmid stabilization system protein ParE
MSRIVFHPEAENELIESAVWYEARQPGLGKRFLAAVESSLIKIQNNPGIFQQLESENRRCMVQHFPYGVIFRERNMKIEIIAIMHLHRKPGYWVERGDA